MPVIVAPSPSQPIHPLAGTGQVDIEIGVINNLSDAGLKSGEQQWTDLITRAAGSRTVRLHFFTLPQIARSERAKARIDQLYHDPTELKGMRLDGLIVTGCEPGAADLRDEAFWGALTDIVDWATDNTRSTIWSCLSAHAAVLHLDGIRRRRLTRKCSGTFSVQRVGAHPLVASVDDRACVPHSRHNDLDEGDLVRQGYEILTRSPAVGVDCFVKRTRSLFVFLQGHPEYDREALGREYRRDVIRYLDGVTSAYPHLPEHYFTAATEAVFESFATRARRDRAAVARPPEAGALREWRDSFAATLLGNWLEHLTAEVAVRAA